jgi:uncharacterized protein YyaL (SSP411 family)
MARAVVFDWLRYAVGAVQPVAGETLERAALAAAWIARAQDATKEGGLSYGYLPCREPRGWRAAYPETSGYTVPTLFEYAVLAGDDDYRRRGVQMAQFVLRCQLPSGAVYGGTVRPAEGAIPVAFNTGMVLQGLLAAYRETRDAQFLAGARRAAEFLVADIGPDGNFQSHGPFVHAHTIKTYTCLCAWPLWLASAETGEPRFATAAYRVGDAALVEQRQSGWFANNCLSTNAGAPLLHTIAYTLQGLLELGVVASRAEYVTAVRTAVDRLLPHCTRGFLHGRWFEDWQPGAFSSCLTGSAQLAVVSYRLADYTGEMRYRAAADAVVNYLKALQSTSATDPGILGGIAGSFPLTGSYIRLGFPGWATKFFLDALMWQHRFREGDAGTGRATTREPAMSVTGAPPVHLAR